MTYISEGFTPKENKIQCNHKFRRCDCSAVHCIGNCRMWQQFYGKWKIKNKKGQWVTMLIEPEPEKRAPCEFHVV